MNRLIVFCIGAFASVVSEVFWKGESRWTMALWGGMGMLLLRRIVLRFSSESRALLCLFGALLLIVLRLALLIVQALSRRAADKRPLPLWLDLPSFSYGLYRFLLIAPAYAVIEYVEGRLGI